MQEAFSQLDGVLEGGKGGEVVGGGGEEGSVEGVGVQGRQAAVTPHTAFSGHGLYFWHASTAITHDAPLLHLWLRSGCLLTSQG